MASGALISALLAAVHCMGFFCLSCRFLVGSSDCAAIRCARATFWAGYYASAYKQPDCEAGTRAAG